MLVALLLRLAVLPFLISEQLQPERDHWRFGYETGRLARSIAEGKGFANPLFGDTGPSAWMPPVYPYIIAGFFKCFGIYTKNAAVAILVFQAFLSSLTCIPLFLIAQKMFGSRAALWTGWMWALCPYAIYFPLQRVWETWLSTLLLTLLVLAVLYLETSDRILWWLGYGALWGLAALTSPTLLSVLPFISVWACYRLSSHGRRWVWPPAASALAFIVIVSPWFVRNYQVFHRFVPFRDNFGVTLLQGNHGENYHSRCARTAGPWHNEGEWQDFQRLGELEYMHRCQLRATAFIRSHPRWFAGMSLRRASMWWTGYWSFDRDYLKEEPLDLYNIPFCTSLTLLALAGLWRAWINRVRSTVVIAVVLLIYPLAYYITTWEDYYRRPIDAILVLLAAYAASEFTVKRKQPSLAISDDRYVYAELEAVE